MHPRTFNPKNADKSYAFGVRIEATICRHTSPFSLLLGTLLADSVQRKGGHLDSTVWPTIGKNVPVTKIW